MDAADVLKRLGGIRQTFRDRRPKFPPHNDLISCGWRQADRNGLFFESPKNRNGYSVDMCKCNPPYVHFVHSYQKLSGLDGVPEPDLGYLNGRLEELEIWLEL